MIQGRASIDAGCTVSELPYSWEQLDASKVNWYPPSFFPFGASFCTPKEKDPSAPPYDEAVKDPVMLGPNITGHVQSGYCAVVDGGNTPVGALYLDTPANIIARGNENSNQRRGLGIDASLSSTIFGGSETVQPTALKFLPCIKT